MGYKYNLTQESKTYNKKKSALNNFIKRKLRPYATSIGEIITVIRGGDIEVQGTYTNSDKIYEVFLSWCSDGIELVNFRREEIQFGKDIVENLFSNYTIVPQYLVLNKYRIDWYIPALNLAIEFDEPSHLFNLKNDSKRQEEIEKHLGCRFLRYNYKYEDKDGD